MLAESRRRQTDRARVTVELPRRSDLADRAGPWMLDLDPHSTRGRQRAGECFLDIEDRTRRDATFLEPGQPLLTCGATQSSRDLSVQIRARGLPLRVGSVSRIEGKLGRVEDFAEALKLNVCRHRDIDEAIRHRESAIGNDGRVIVAVSA